ncbi:COG3904 family protein [Chachezhania sediminis]|uniref:COG3904 family protein n=1 Tax=Chachezhania sediminis TaxID=2599291 RepID=UPI00131C238F|nr:hypothetical protein [Chachezhania sediminis]
MSDATEVPAARSARSIRRVILGVLWLQVAIALYLAGSDIGARLDGLASGWRPSAAPSIREPVAPGDQTRRYRPADMGPQPSDPSRRVAFPGGDSLPPRLAFEEADGTAFLKGTIAPGDAARFGEWLADRPDLTAVRLMSPGGSVQDALQIGRAIRSAGLETAMLAGDICYSACPYVLAGGVRRQVDDGASVGVHQHYFGESTVLPAFVAVEKIQQGQARVVAYLDEMGIDLRLTEHALATPPDEIYVLIPKELRDYRLVTPAENQAAVDES